ncbi:hypothetical protein [Nocardia sp. NPDC005745]|uniref:hypothetical protein n=1 Tax=Nocardia sp. NPDC005745 TaxID=3157061 RepID=UPI0033DCB893
MSSAFVRNGRTDVVAGDSLARALYAPMFDSATIDRHGRPNIARRKLVADPRIDSISHSGGLLHQCRAGARILNATTRMFAVMA